MSPENHDRLKLQPDSRRYQIVQSNQVPHRSKILNDRRGDLMLLINGMPVIHMELKRAVFHQTGLQPD